MSPTAVVTGASSGIGAASARALAADGFHVVCAARRKDRIEALAEEIDGRAVVCDVTDAASVAELAAAVDSVDVLLNNAGGAFDQATVEEADVEDWAQMFDLNVLGVLRVTQALLPALRADGGGLIVNLGSTAGRIAYEGGGGYTAAKHGLKVLTQTMRLEHRRRAAADHRDRTGDGQDRGVHAEAVPGRPGAVRRGVRRSAGAAGRRGHR